MRANELRIGNLIQTDNSTEHFIDVEKVQSIQYDGINITDGIGNTYETEFSYDFINPIQLTEQWLLAFGFENIQSTIYQLKINDVLITVSFYDSWIVAITNNQIHLEYTGYPTIHEFQNMVFLTGEELKLKK